MDEALRQEWWIALMVEMVVEGSMLV